MRSSYTLGYRKRERWRPVGAARIFNGLQPIGSVADDEFVRVMVTNALSPMRVIEALHDRVPEGGLIGAMSSGQGSIGNNPQGKRELYRGSKAALNMFMRSFAAREAMAGRALLLLAPGWIRTAFGGPDAPFTVEESARSWSTSCSPSAPARASVSSIATATSYPGEGILSGETLPVAGISRPRQC